MVHVSIKIRGGGVFALPLELGCAAGDFQIGTITVAFHDYRGGGGENWRICDPSSFNVYIPKLLYIKKLRKLMQNCDPRMYPNCSKDPIHVSATFLIDIYIQNYRVSPSPPPPPPICRTQTGILLQQQQHRAGLSPSTSSFCNA